MELEIKIAVQSALVKMPLLKLLIGLDDYKLLQDLTLPQELVYLCDHFFGLLLRTAVEI